MRIFEIKKASKLLLILAEITITFDTDYVKVIKILKEHVHLRLFQMPAEEMAFVEKFEHNARRFLHHTIDITDDVALNKFKARVPAMLDEIAKLKDKI